jgi:hypothetical protein
MPKRRNTIAKLSKHVVSFDGDGHGLLFDEQLPTEHGRPDAPIRGPPLMTVAEVAAFLRCSKSILNKWRCSGTGPNFVRIGGGIRYRATDVAAFVADGVRVSTSQTEAAA